MKEIEVMVSVAQEYLKWSFDLANAITGFSAVQMLAFLYALQRFEKLVINVRESWWITFIAIAISGVVYSGLVAACLNGEKTLLESLDAWDQLKTISIWTMVGRIVVIWLMTGLGLTVLIIDRIKQTRILESKQDELQKPNR